MTFDKLNNYLNAHNNFIRNIYFTIISCEILIFSYYIFSFISTHEDGFEDKLNGVLNSIVAFGSILLLSVTYEYVMLTSSLVEETRKTREAQEKPSISFRVVPDENNPNNLKYSIKNSGAGSAFDIHLSFDPDINNETIYGKIPRSISYIGPQEEIRFLFAYAPKYFENANSVKQFAAKIKYSKYPISEKVKYGADYYESPVEYPINVEELRNAQWVERKNVHDIAEELIKIKEGIFLIGQQLIDLDSISESK